MYLFHHIYVTQVFERSMMVLNGGRPESEDRRIQMEAIAGTFYSINLQKAVFYPDSSDLLAPIRDAGHHRGGIVPNRSQRARQNFDCASVSRLTCPPSLKESVATNGDADYSIDE